VKCKKVKKVKKKNNVAFTATLFFFVYFILQKSFMLRPYLKSFVTSKWKRITVLIALYTILLTVFFDNSDFTGLIELEEKVDKIKKDVEGKGKKETTELELVVSLLDVLIERFTFVVITISSVGYGDVVPKSRRLRLVNSFFILVLIYVLYND